MITINFEDDYGTTIDDERIIQQMKLIVEKLIADELEWLQAKHYINAEISLDAIREYIQSYPSHNLTMPPDDVFETPLFVAEHRHADGTHSIAIDHCLWIDSKESSLIICYECVVDRANVPHVEFIQIVS